MFWSGMPFICIFVIQIFVIQRSTSPNDCYTLCLSSCGVGSGSGGFGFKAHSFSHWAPGHCDVMTSTPASIFLWSQVICFLEEGWSCFKKLKLLRLKNSNGTTLGSNIRFGTVEWPRTKIFNFLPLLGFPRGTDEETNECVIFLNDSISS